MFKSLSILSSLVHIWGWAGLSHKIGMKDLSVCCFTPSTQSDLIKHPPRSWADKHHNKSNVLLYHFSPSDSSDTSSPSLWSGCPRLHVEIKVSKNIYIKDYVWVVISACLSSNSRKKKTCDFGWKMKRRWGEIYNDPSLRFRVTLLIEEIPEDCPAFSRSTWLKNGRD